jgi:hypothetical protein
MRSHHIVVFLPAAVALCPTLALAQNQACSTAYERAQEERAKGGLRAAHTQLQICVDRDCPKFIREDCTRWLEQVETSLPTVVFAVRRDGDDQTEVEVTCDGATLVTFLDGKAVALDPGPRTFSFRIPGFAPVERQLLIREGERNRMVEVEFRSPKTPMVGAMDAAADAEGMRNRRTWSYGLGGAGALGLAGFALFAALGSSQQGDLERTCSPYCQESQVDSVKTKYVMADACLGVGLVALGVATYLYLTSRGEPQGTGDSESATTVSFVPRSGSGGVLQLSTSF